MWDSSSDRNDSCGCNYFWCYAKMKIREDMFYNGDNVPRFG